MRTCSKQATQWWKPHLGLGERGRVFSHELYCTHVPLGLENGLWPTSPASADLPEHQHMVAWPVCAVPDASRQEEEQVLCFYSASPLAMGCA